MQDLQVLVLNAALHQSVSTPLTPTIVHCVRLPLGQKPSSSNLLVSTSYYQLSMPHHRRRSSGLGGHDTGFPEQFVGSRCISNSIMYSTTCLQVSNTHTFQSNSSTSRISPSHCPLGAQRSGYGQTCSANKHDASAISPSATVRAR